MGCDAPPTRTHSKAIVMTRVMGSSDSNESFFVEDGTVVIHSGARRLVKEASAEQAARTHRRPRACPQGESDYPGWTQGPQEKSHWHSSPTFVNRVLEVVAMSEQTDRDATLREIARKTVACRLPGMDTLPARRSLSYRATRGSELPMDIYYPSVDPGRRPPVVLAPLAYPDPEARVRRYGPLTSWAQLIAASGMAAVLFGAETPEEDVHAALHHLHDAAGALGLGMDRVGVFAASGNVTVALSTVMRHRHIRCAALLYGYTMDLDGSTAVADMARQAGFANACAGKTVDDLPDDVPTLFVRAGRDRCPGLNAALDAVVARALARNLPFTLINHAGGGHGFDLEEDTAISHGIVRQVLAFLRLHLMET